MGGCLYYGYEDNINWWFLFQILEMVLMGKRNLCYILLPTLKQTFYYEQLHVVYVEIMRLKYRKHKVLLNDTIFVVPMNAKKITELN